MFSFDSIPKYCINLKRRPDRRARAEQEFKRIGIGVEFIDAVDGENIELPSDSPKAKDFDGKAQCANVLSHLSVIRRAEGEYVFICEDDVIFCDDFKSRMADVEIDFDLFYVGGWYDKQNLEEIVSPYYRVKAMAGSHAYILHRRAFDRVSSLNYYDWGMDQLLTDVVLKEFNGVTCLPMMASTIPSYSDIQQRVTDYNQTFRVWA